MEFALYFVIKKNDGHKREIVVAIGECEEEMAEVFEELPYWRNYWYECRPYDGEQVGDETIK